MSEADKLFEELGYMKYIVDDYVTTYVKNEYIYISINKLNESFTKYMRLKDNSCELYAKSVTFDELIAINMKVSELGWSDE